MAKGKGTSVMVEKHEESHVGEFVNSAGVTFKIIGLPPLAIPNLQQGVIMPKKPQYSTTTVAGDVEYYDHDESTLVTNEDKVAWAKYLEDSKTAQDELTNRMINCILIEGVLIDDNIDLSRWESKQRLMGMKIPEDIEEKLLQYKKTAVIRSSEDIKVLMNEVMALTGVSAEAIEEAKKSFPDSV
jgi:hypothetical protein